MKKKLLTTLALSSSVLFTSFSFVLPVSFTTTSVEASGEQKIDGERGFSVRIKESESQVEEKLPYFHYQVEKDKSYTNTYVLENRTKKAKTIEVMPVNAFTNPFASFNFSEKDKTDLSIFNDDNRKFANFVEGPSSIELAPEQTKEVSLTVKVPASIDEGEVIGAVVFEEANQNSESSSDDSTVLTSKVNFIISTLLEFKTEEIVSLKFGTVDFNNDYATPRIEAEIINQNSSFLKESTLKYTVKSKSGKMLFEGFADVNRFAPSTNVLVPIQWEHKSLKTGDYSVDLTFSSKNKEFETFSNNVPFEITKDMLKQHQVDYGEEKIKPNVDLGSAGFYAVLLLALGLGVGTGIFLMKRKERLLEAKFAEKMKIEGITPDSTEPVESVNSINTTNKSDNTTPDDSEPKDK